MLYYFILLHYFVKIMESINAIITTIVTITIIDVDAFSCADMLFFDFFETQF